jgi:hypothetical protein
MTAHTLIQKLQPFKGKQIINCADEIKAIAEPLGYSVNVQDPTYNVVSIDSDYRRLNVRTDENSVVTSFTLG